MASLKEQVIQLSAKVEESGYSVAMKDLSTQLAGISVKFPAAPQAAPIPAKVDAKGGDGKVHPEGVVAKEKTPKMLFYKLKLI